MLILLLYLNILSNGHDVSNCMVAKFKRDDTSSFSYFIRKISKKLICVSVNMMMQPATLFNRNKINDTEHRTR